MKIAKASKQDFIIYSDSQYCTKGVLEYMDNWKRKGWSGIKNPDLWQSLYPMWQEIKHRTKLQWVRGHNGNVGNELADKYAVHGKLHEDKSTSTDNLAVVFLTGNRTYECIT
jgi:ribonuclease HI